MRSMGMRTLQVRRASRRRSWAASPGCRRSRRTSGCGTGFAAAAGECLVRSGTRPSTAGQRPVATGRAVSGAEERVPWSRARLDNRLQGMQVRPCVGRRQACAPAPHPCPCVVRRSHLSQALPNRIGCERPPRCLRSMNQNEVTFPSGKSDLVFME
jgi:hypothetical protein